MEEYDEPYQERCPYCGDPDCAMTCPETPEDEERCVHNQPPGRCRPCWEESVFEEVVEWGSGRS